MTESFNLFSRLNERFQLTDEDAIRNAAVQPLSAYARRQFQFARRIGF